MVHTKSYWDIEADLQFLANMQDVVAKSKSDPKLLRDGLTELAKKKSEWATQQHAVEVEQDKTSRDKLTAVQGVFRTLLSTELGEVWDKSKSGFAATLKDLVTEDSTIHTLAFIVDIDRAEVEGVQTITVGKPHVMFNPTGKRARTNAAAGTGTNGSGRGKGQILTVDGKEFPSAAAAARDILKDESSMSRLVIISKLKDAQHIVVE